jgi:four helix bundle protein
MSSEGRTEDRNQRAERMQLNSATDLTVYKNAYELAMRIFKLSHSFPPEEKFALTSQIRRSSRSVCMNLREAWSKRRYEAHFISKLTDCAGESNETETSLDFAYDCGYLTEVEYKALSEQNRSVGRMLGSMLKDPTGFLIQENK